MRHLVLRAALAAGFLTPASAIAADPVSGTLTAANDAAHPLTYTSDGADDFALTIDLPFDYGLTHPQTFIKLTFTGAVDQGEAVESDSSTGDPGDPTAHWAQGGDPAGDGVDQMFLPPDGGLRNAVVNASGTGPITVTIALVEVPDDPGDRTLPYVAQGIGPRFAAYKPIGFPGIGLSAAEPTLGINPNTGSVFYMNTIEPLRVKFDDATSPAQHVWQSAPGNISSVVTTDPIIMVDATTGRVFNVQLTGPISAAEFSDDDGVTWLRAAKASRAAAWITRRSAQVRIHPPASAR